MDKLQTCAAAIQEILSSWTGLYFFCVGNKQAIFSIIEALSLPNDEIRVCVFYSRWLCLTLIPHVHLAFRIYYSPFFSLYWAA